MTRQLKLDRTSAEAPLIPCNPMQWTVAELADWHDYLEGTGRFRSLERRWASMENYRESHIESAVTLTMHGDASPEVLAEVPLEWLAQRERPEYPALPLAQDALLASLNALNIGGGNYDATAEEVLRSALPRLGRTFDRNGCVTVELPGGLRLQSEGRTVRGLWADAVVFDTIVSRDVLRGLRRLVVRWRRAVRHALAARAFHVVPTARARVVGSVVQLGITEISGQDHYFVHRCEHARGENWMRAFRLDATRHEVPERYALAGELARDAHDRTNGARALAVLNRVAQIHLSDLKALRQPIRSEQDILSALDDTARAMIRPSLAGAPVGLEDRADTFAVWVDGMTGPRLFATVHSLRLAADLERAVRVTATLRLSLAAGATRCGA